MAKITDKDKEEFYKIEEILDFGTGVEKPLNYDKLVKTTRKLIDGYNGDTTILRNVKRLLDVGQLNINPFIVELFVCNHDFPVITDGFDRPNGIYPISPEFTEYIDNTYNSILRGGTVEPISRGKVKMIQVLRLDMFYRDQYHITFKFRKEMTPVNALIKREWIYLDEQGINKGLFYPNSENAKIISGSKYKIYDALTIGEGRKLKPHQITGAEFFLEKKKAMNADLMGMGKSQDVNTLIPMADGTFKRLGDIVVGDRVLSSTNEPTTVVNVYDTKKKWVYYFGLSNGLKVNCSYDHLWYYRYKRDDKFRIGTLEEIIGVSEEEFDSISDEERVVTLNEPIILPQPSSNSNFFNKREDVHFESDRDDYLNIVGGRYPDQDRYELEKEYANWLAEVVKTRNLEIAGYTPFDKMYIQYKQDFIDTHYSGSDAPKNMRDLRINDIVFRLSQHRRRLIVSMIVGNNGYIDFKDLEVLRSDFVRLCMSCGFLATLDGTIVHVCASRHYSRFLKRDDSYLTKAEDGEHVKNVEDFLTVTQIYKSHIADCKCIEVDSEDRTYLTEGFTVTHNTTTAVISAIEANAEKTLIVTTASLKTNWERELLNYVKKEDISIVTPSKIDLSKRFTIINYDLLRKYITIPEELAFKDEWAFDPITGKRKKIKVPVMVKNANGDLVQKVIKTRSATKIKEALENSELYKVDFKTVIIDEAHKLSNNKSKMYECMDKFLKKEGNGDNVFMLTGTPISNKPINLYHVLKLIDAPITKNYKAYVNRYCGAKKIKLKDGRQVLLTNGATNLKELAYNISEQYIRRGYSDVEGFVGKNIIEKFYDLNDKQQMEYDRLWDEYVNKKLEESGEEVNLDLLDHKEFLEMAIVRKYLAMEMVEHTIERADTILESGENEKVVIATTYTDELNKFKEYYKDKCVVYNGQMNAKEKDEALDKFLNDKSVRVFIGNIVASSVGLSLTSSRHLIFNSVSFVSIDNEQMEARIQRLTSTETALVYYQYFTDKVSMRVKEILDEKRDTNSVVIRNEDNKVTPLKTNEVFITSIGESVEEENGKWSVVYTYQGLKGNYGEVVKYYDTYEESRKLELADTIQL